MFDTGRRTIFDVCRPHTGHSISMLEIQEEGVVKGIKVYCNTCRQPLIIQETDDYDIRKEIATRKSSRLSGMSYDQWENQFYRELIAEHDAECDCGSWDGCENFQNYEGSELSEFYNDYLNTLAPPTPRQPEPWDTGQEPVTPVAPPSEQGRNWQETQPVVPESAGWEQDDTGWTT